MANRIAEPVKNTVKKIVKIWLTSFRNVHRIKPVVNNGNIEIEMFLKQLYHILQ